MLELQEGDAGRPAVYPFVLLDRVLVVERSERATGLRNVTANDPLLAGGGRPPTTLRRALLIEAFAQLAGVALAGEDAPAAPVEPSLIESMEFTGSPVPGDQLILSIELEGGAETDPVRASCTAEVGGAPVARGRMEFQRVSGG